MRAQSGDMSETSALSPGSGASAQGGAPLRKAPVSYPWRALTRKTGTLQLRQRKTNCCQICFPVTTVILIFLLQLLVNSTTSGIGSSVMINTYPRNDLVLGNVGGRSIAYTSPSTMGYYPPSAASPGLLNSLTSAFSSLNATVGYFPSWSNFSSAAVMNHALMTQILAADNTDNIFQGQGNNNNNNNNNPDQNKARSVAYGAINTMVSTANLLIASILVNNNSLARFCANNNVGIDKSSSLTGAGAPLLIDPCSVVTGFTTANMLTSMFAKSFFNKTITASVQAMPFKFTQQAISVAEFIGTLAFPLLAMFLLPVFLHLIVVEKQERLREFSKMNGMKMKTYWIVTYLFDMLLFCLSTLFFFIASGIFQFKFILQTWPVLYVLLYFFFGWCMVSMAVFLSAFLSKSNSATILGYSLVLIFAISGFVIEVFVFADNPQRPFFYLLIPPYAFCYGLIYLLLQCASYQCVSFNRVTASDPAVTAIIYLFFEMFIYGLLGIYLDLVLKSQFGIRKHPLFCFARFNEKKRFQREAAARQHSLLGTEAGLSSSSSSSAAALGVNGSGDELTGALDGEVEDEDVAEERRSIQSGRINEMDTAVLLRNMRKIYDSDQGKKVAVRNLCLSIGRNECFSLLGPNGAGKSTTVSIITGLYPPTSGDVFVAGYDIGTQRTKVHLTMGVCPQFDCLWMELSAKDHLLFYARLKGVSKDQEQRHVAELLGKVGLQGEIGLQPVRTLSGGQRRRVAIAISLCGDPKLILMDEPSTGLDPSTRRQIWSIIAEAKKNRSVLLVTHSMEEADLLSDRIGIMSLGRLRCLGTPLHLKSKFGQGYRLSVNYAEADESRALNFIQRVAPSARVAHSFAGNTVLEIPRADVRLSEFYARIDDGKAANGIRDFSIAFTSLEDVFLELVSKEEITPAIDAK